MQKRWHVIGEGKHQQVRVFQAEREKEGTWVCVCLCSGNSDELWPLARSPHCARGVRGHMASVWAPIERSNTLRHVSLTSLCNTRSSSDIVYCMLTLFVYLCLHLVCVCEFIHVSVSGHIFICFLIESSCQIFMLLLDEIRKICTLATPNGQNV